MPPSLLSIALLALLVGCSSLSADPGVTPLGIEVTDWSTDEFDGEIYLHLWSHGTPKSVYQIPVSRLPPGFLEALRAKLPTRVGLPVELLLEGSLKETIVEVEAASVAQ
jgi:hypothetical protein